MLAVTFVTASFILLFSLFLSLFPVLAHQDVIILQNNTLIARNINVEGGLGAFSIVITYNPNTTTIFNVSSVPPFTVVSNINNTAGISYISGFHGQIPGPTGDVRLAILQIEGSDNLSISVEELIDTSGKDINISSANEQMEKLYREEGNSEMQSITSETSEGTLLPSSPSAPSIEETSSATVTPTPTATPTVLAIPIATPTPMPSPRIPGFEGTCAIAGLFVAAYLVLKRENKGNY
jgi:hypothetical protein